MASRKTTFEIVPLVHIAPLLKNAEVLGATQQSRIKAAPKPAKILSVSHDKSLAATREMLFSSAGFHVSSALTAGQAIQLCATEEFALVVIGHSMPPEERKWLLKELRDRCTAPVLALRRLGEQPLTGADYILDSTENPALLLEAVVNILRPKAR
jgi:DNA-binding response OmpR family regulator